MIKVLVTGANGQLGKCLQDIVNNQNLEGYSFEFVNRAQLDITDSISVDHYLSSSYNFLVNCAAYTAVDKAEEEKEEAFAVNALAVGALAEKCYEKGIQFIHISTDYVFDGEANTPIPVDGPTSPINIYGESKLQGEKLAVENNPNTIIIRTSWVYSSYGSNFVTTMLKLFKEKQELSIVEDQKGSPTNAHDLARAIVKIITSANIVSGIFHYTGKGETNWFEFACEIKKCLKSKIKINPILSSAYPTLAQRPKYSVLALSKIKEIYGVEVPDWRESLRKSLK